MTTDPDSRDERDMSARGQPCGEASADAEVFAGLTVETAAVRIGEAVFTLPRPNRHHNVMWWLHVLGIASSQMHDQGFVLSDGTYANRIVAARAAKAAGQVVRMISPPHLYSEDLWDGGCDLPRMDDIKALTAPLRSGVGDEPRDEPSPATLGGVKL